MAAVQPRADSADPQPTAKQAPAPGPIHKKYEPLDSVPVVDEEPPQELQEEPFLVPQEESLMEPEISATDEHRAQLDLANAYLSMGDEKEAVELLNDLLEQATDPDIRQEVEHLLSKLN